MRNSDSERQEQSKPTFNTGGKISRWGEFYFDWICKEAFVKRMTTVFREMLESPGIIHAPIAYDPLTARIAEKVGFQALDLGGYALGASSCVPEPLLSLTEVVEATRRITAAVQIPLMVDGGGGYGDPLPVVLAVKGME